jgi:hypothetical protein
MDNFIDQFKIRINKHIYIKDPESSALGKKIISGSIDLIEDIGFEQYTFRKLSVKINSTEASIYRYFENKHKVLLYLTMWYWRWMEYKVVLNTINIECPKERLKRSLDAITEKVQEDGSFSHINEIKLQRIIIAESSKALFTKSVKEQNKDGVYNSYKNLVEEISKTVLEINPDYKYPHMLVSTVIEASHHQRFFAQYIPSLTDIYKNEDAISIFYEEMAFKMINQ